MVNYMAIINHLIADNHFLNYKNYGQIMDITVIRFHN